MSLNFEMKEKFLTKLELTDLFFIKGFSYISVFIALINALAYATLFNFNGAQNSDFSFAHFDINIVFLVYSFIFLFFAGGFEEKFGFVQFKKLALFLIAIFILYPLLAVNSINISYSIYIITIALFIGLFTILVVAFNTRHGYVQEYLAEQKSKLNDER